MRNTDLLCENQVRQYLPNKSNLKCENNSERSGQTYLKKNIRCIIIHRVHIITVLAFDNNIEMISFT